MLEHHVDWHVGENNQTFYERVLHPASGNPCLASVRDGAHSYGEAIEIADGRRLRPLPLGPADRFLPRGLGEYGSPEELSTRVRAYLCSVLPLAPQALAVMAAFVLGSWAVPTLDFFPLLYVAGEDAAARTACLRALAPILRRPVLLASFTPAIMELLIEVQRTLLFDVPQTLPRALEELLRASSEPGLAIYWRDRVLDVFGPRVVASPGTPPPALADRALVIAALDESPAPPPQEMIAAEELTPQLARLRLDWSLRAPLPRASGRRPFDRIWATIEPFLGDAGDARLYAEALAPAVDSWPPERSALLAALFRAAHRDDDFVTLRTLAAEVAAELEADALGKVDPRALGHILRHDWRLYPKRSGSGYRLPMNRITRERIHLLAASSDLPPEKKCAVCARHRPVRPGPATAARKVPRGEQCAERA